MSDFTLTAQTVEILKNFARISPQLAFKAGKFQRTCHSSRTFIADVELDADIPVDCAVYNLNNLLGIIDIGKGVAYPSIDFGPTSLTVRGEYSSVTLPYAHPSVVPPTPDVKFSIVEKFASFELPNSQWARIKKTAAILDTPILEFVINDGNFSVRLINEEKKGDDTMGSASFVFPNTVVDPSAPNESWSVNLNTLEIISGEYDVQFGNMSSGDNSKKLFGAFFNLKSAPVSYITAGHVTKK